MPMVTRPSGIWLNVKTALPLLSMKVGGWATPLRLKVTLLVAGPDGASHSPVSWADGLRCTWAWTVTSWLETGLLALMLVMLRALLVPSRAMVQFSCAGVTGAKLGSWLPAWSPKLTVTV